MKISFSYYPRYEVTSFVFDDKNARRGKALNDSRTKVETVTFKTSKLKNAAPKDHPFFDLLYFGHSRTN